MNTFMCQTRQRDRQRQIMYNRAPIWLNGQRYDARVFPSLSPSYRGRWTSRGFSFPGGLRVACRLYADGSSVHRQESGARARAAAPCLIAIIYLRRRPTPGRRFTTSAHNDYQRAAGRPTGPNNKKDLSAYQQPAPLTALRRAHFNRF